MSDRAYLCPSCGLPQHRLSENGTAVGMLFCDSPDCPEPDALERILADPHIHQHVVRISSHGTWTVKHPLIERLDDRLFECSLPAYMNDEDPVGCHVMEPDRVYLARPYRSTWSFALVTDG